MKKTRKALVFISVMVSIMLMSFTNAFAHHGGRGGCGGRGYYNSNVAYSCPYGNTICNQNGYCINHNVNYYSNTNPIQQQAPVVNTDVITVDNTTDNSSQNVAVINTKSVAPVNSNQSDITIENLAITDTTVPVQTIVPTFVCPNGNTLCNQYGYCINNGYCNGYGNGYGCGRSGRCGGRYIY